MHPPLTHRPHLSHLRHLAGLAALSALTALSLLSPVPSHAHGEAKARHGGTVQKAQDLGFELVAQADGALLYVEDHGKPKDTRGMQGRLTVMSGGQKSQATLSPAGGNVLQAKGAVLKAGAKAVVVLNTAQGQAITLRFVLP